MGVISTNHSLTCTESHDPCNYKSHVCHQQTKIFCSQYHQQCRSEEYRYSSGSRLIAWVLDSVGLLATTVLRVFDSVGLLATTVLRVLDSVGLLATMILRVLDSVSLLATTVLRVLDSVGLLAPTPLLFSRHRNILYLRGIFFSKRSSGLHTAFCHEMLS